MGKCFIWAQKFFLPRTRPYDSDILILKVSYMFDKELVISITCGKLGISDDKKLNRKNQLRYYKFLVQLQI